MVKEELCNSGGFAVNVRHGFCPFGEVVDCYNYVCVALGGGCETFHVVNGPLVEGACSNDEVQGSRWGSCFRSENLEKSASFNSVDTFFEDG